MTHSDARRDLRSAAPTPRDAEYYVRLPQLAKLLELDNSFDVPDDPRVFQYVLEGIVQERTSR